MRTLFITERDASKLTEQFDLFFIITDLKIAVIDDDRTFQNGWIGNDEIAEFADRHRIDVDVVFSYDLGSLGNQIIGSVFRSGNQITDLILIQKRLENVLFNERESVFLHVCLGLAAGNAAGRCINDDHISIIQQNVHSPSSEISP